MVGWKPVISQALMILLLHLTSIVPSVLCNNNDIALALVTYIVDVGV